MFQKSRGRPGGRVSDVARALIPILRESDRALTHRKIAEVLHEAPSTVRRALLLLAGIHPNHYIEDLDPEDHPRVEVRGFAAARKGIVCYSAPHGGWYWWENEERLRRRTRDLRNLPSKQEQAWGGFVQRWLEDFMARANRSPRTIRIFNQGARRLGDPFVREWAEQMGFVFDPQGKIYTVSLLEGVFPWLLRRFPRLTFWMRPWAANWLRRPDLVDRPHELAQGLERAVRRWRRWAAQP